MPLCAAAMSEGTTVKSAPPILTSLASAADSQKSSNSACTAQTTEELQDRLAEIARLAPAARSSQEPVSYNSAITEDNEQDLAARLEGIALLHPPGPMHQQFGTSSSQAATEPSPVFTGATNSATFPIFPFQAVVHVPIITPVYPIQVLGAVDPASLLGYIWPSSSRSSMPRAFDRSEPEPGMGRTRKRDRSQRLRKSQIVVVDDVESTEAPSRRKHLKARTGDAKDEPTEEEWQDRFRKRQDGIKNMKSSHVYYEHKDFPHKVLKLHRRPRTPDVYNRTLSKREWEACSAEWRAAWREVDGVACLMNMHYPEKRSQKAWQKAAEQLKEEKKQLQKDKKKKLVDLADVCLDKAEHKVSAERAHQKHKEQAIEILKSSKV